jgi:NAD(P)H-flavin reductase/NAD-dependent dihydropyrimidine dehydrogenase PreA subunit
MKSSFNIKTNRVFTPLRKYGWLFTIMVGVGGLWFPKLGLLVILVILSLTTVSFFKGRFWCGNFCPHGSLFDSIVMHISNNKNIPSFLRSRVLAGLFFIFFGFSLSGKFIKIADSFGTLSYPDKAGYIFVTTYLMVIIVGGFLSLFVAPRTWCNFCPMGSIQTLSYKLGKRTGVSKKSDEKITIANTSMCHSCGKCARVCPMQLTPYLEFTDNNQFDNEACIRCSTCVANCPAGILSLSTEKESAEIVSNTSSEGYTDRVVIQSVIDEIRHFGDDVTEYTFKFQEPEVVHYKPGQFVLVKIQDKPKMFRAFSISSYHEDGRRLSITIKKVPGGYGSGIISGKFKLGDSVELEGPMGHELVLDKNADKVLLVAGGIGITPFRAMVKDIVENQEHIRSARLIYGVNNEKDFLYNDEFKEFEAQSDKFEYSQVVASDSAWSGEKGYVTDLIRKTDLTGYQIYMCGPDPMIEATLKTLKAMGANDEVVYYESA